MRRALMLPAAVVAGIRAQGDGCGFGRGDWQFPRIAQLRLDDRGHDFPEIGQGHPDIGLELGNGRLDDKQCHQRYRHKFQASKHSAVAFLTPVLEGGS